VETQSNASEDISLFFLSGYLSSLFQRNEDFWDEQIEDLASNTKITSWYQSLPGFQVLLTYLPFEFSAWLNRVW
jgi:hypothetical protein